MRPQPHRPLPHRIPSTIGPQVLLVLLALLVPAAALAVPQISLPASFNIGAQRVGVASDPIDLLVQNDGDMPLQVTAAAFGGTNPGDFTRVTALPLSVPARGAQPLQFTFKPGALGARSTVLTLTSNDPMTPMAGTTLLGAGVAPAFEHTPTSLTFARQRTGACGPSQLVRINNSGTGPLRVLGAAFEGAGASSFRVGSSTASVPAGGSGYVEVRFCPLAVGMISANLAISTDLMAGHKATVALTGTGFGPVITIQPAEIDFGAVFAGTVSQGKPVTIKNSGDDATTIATVALAGKDPGQFTGMLPTAGTAIMPGATLSFDMSARLSDAMPREAELIITLTEDLLPGKEARIPLRATGAVSSVSLSPMSISCGSAFLGTRAKCQAELSVRNLGAQPLQGLMVAPNLADFQVEQVPQMVAPMATVRIPVFFRPAKNGQRSGLLIVRALGLLGMNQINVTGTGQDVNLNLSPTLLQFDSVAIGEMPVNRVLTLENLGGVPLDLDVAVDPPPDTGMEPEFTVSPQTLNVPPGELGQITVTFTPRVSGDKTPTLQLLLSGTLIVLQTVDIHAAAFTRPEEKPTGCAAAPGRGAGRGPGRDHGAGRPIPLALLLPLAIALGVPAVLLDLRRRRSRRARRHG